MLLMQSTLNEQFGQLSVYLNQLDQQFQDQVLPEHLSKEELEIAIRKHLEEELDLCNIALINHYAFRDSSFFAFVISNILHDEYLMCEKEFPNIFKTENPTLCAPSGNNAFDTYRDKIIAAILTKCCDNNDLDTYFKNKYLTQIFQLYPRPTSIRILKPDHQVRVIEYLIHNHTLDGFSMWYYLLDCYDVLDFDQIMNLIIDQQPSLLNSDTIYGQIMSLMSEKEMQSYRDLRRLSPQKMTFNKNLIESLLRYNLLPSAVFINRCITRGEIEILELFAKQNIDIKSITSAYTHSNHTAALSKICANLGLELDDFLRISQGDLPMFLQMMQS